MKIDSAIMGQINYLAQQHAYAQQHADAQQHAQKIQVINENEIKSILYLGISGLWTKKVDDSQGKDIDHTVDTFI